MELRIRVTVALRISASIFLLLGRSVSFVYLTGGLLFGTLAIVYCRRLIDRGKVLLPKPPQAYDDIVKSVPSLTD
jgi:hypothetical protein